MKVSELIKLLSLYDQDLPVAVQINDGVFVPAIRVCDGLFAHKSNIDGEWLSDNYDDGDDEDESNYLANETDAVSIEH